MNVLFKRASRQQVPLKIGITGPSGSGKTTAALHLTRGLVGPDAPIAFLDTENGSASLYSHLTEFDVLDMNPPYQVAKFLAAITAATEGGYKALIIDSASAEWSELLSEKEALDARGGNSFANWGSITKKHEDFLKAIRNAPIHLIVCLRAKQEHVQDKDSSGRTTVRKVGMAAVQREGMEYELTTVFDIAMDHNAKASKDRTGLFEGRLEPVTQATGRELLAWLNGGGALAPQGAPAPVFEAHPTQAQTGGTAPSADAPTNTAPGTTEPTTAGEVFSQMTPEPNPAPSPEADAFVDGLTPAQFITTEQWQEVSEWTRKGVDLSRQLMAYAVTKGWLKPTAQGLNTLLASCWPQLSNQIKNRSEAFIAHLNSHYPTQAAPAAEPTTTTARGRKPRAA